MIGKGDRVILCCPDDPGFDGHHGVVTWAREKRPRGKLAGLWLNVRIDPPPGIKKFTVEIHANLVELES